MNNAISTVAIVGGFLVARILPIWIKQIRVARGKRRAGRK